MTAVQRVYLWLSFVINQRLCSNMKPWLNSWSCILTWATLLLSSETSPDTSPKRTGLESFPHLEGNQKLCKYVIRLLFSARVPNLLLPYTKAYDPNERRCIWFRTIERHPDAPGPFEPCGRCSVCPGESRRRPSCCRCHNHRHRVYRALEGMVEAGSAVDLWCCKGQQNVTW